MVKLRQVSHDFCKNWFFKISIYTCLAAKHRHYVLSLENVQKYLKASSIHGDICMGVIVRYAINHDFT